jgi:hypothetical protein
METKIEELKSRMEAELKPYQEIQDDRHRRSYECQDDSILYGMSYNVTSDTISRIKRKYDLFIEQVKGGGFLVDQSKMLCLFDLEGNFLTDNIVNGKYGKCFCFTQNGETKFVALAKKESTYEKKGYKTSYRVRTFKYQFNGRISDKGYVIYNNIELLSEEFTNENDPNSFSNTWINYLYQNQK